MIGSGTQASSGSRAVPERLAGKRAIVTGAASGIGRATAIRFAAEGARVLVVDCEETGLQETLAAIRDGGGRGAAQVADVGREDSVASFVRRCIDELGGLEVMFANAGIAGAELSLLELTAQHWEEVLRVNLIGIFLCIQHAARYMTASGGGSILCTSSVAALRAHAGCAHYSASKAGIVSLVQTAANEFARANVRVNAICPGLVETRMTRELFARMRAREGESGMGYLTPLGRPGAVEEMASLALFLASDESSYLTGQAIACDGGFSSTHPYRPDPKG